MDSIPFLKIFDTNFTPSSIPSHVFHNTIQPIFTHKYSCSMMSILNNTGVFVKKLTRENIDQLLASPCQCKPSSPYYDPDHGHVCTPLASIVDNPQLESLIDKGAKFRPRPLSDDIDCTTGHPNSRPSMQRTTDDIASHPYHPLINEARWHIEAAILKYAKALAKQNEIDMDDLDSFLENFMADIDLHLVKLDPEQLDADLLSDSSPIHAHVVKLRKRYIVTYLDKSPNKLCFICPKLYLLKIIEEHFPNPNNLDDPSTEHTYTE
jgi:hypothetical protein